MNVRLPRVRSQTLDSSYIRSLLLPRKKESHKGDYGHVLVLAGSRGMTGAADLCSFAALRTGAGLVTAGVPAGQQPVIAVRVRPEVMTLPLPDAGAGQLSCRALKDILTFIELRKVTALVVGPGLGHSEAIYRLVKGLLSSIDLPVVLDADGISVFQAERGLRIGSLRGAKARLVITPHPGEFSRLTGIPVAALEGDREETARRFADENRLICVLKGNRTVVTDGAKVFLNSTGNPGMATAGSGDVLSGMLAGIINQVKEPRLLNAALAAVFMHGAAGDMAAENNTEMGMVAADIIASLPAAIKKTMDRKK
jgi:NAD(P)H-hydrate epimerase